MSLSAAGQTALRSAARRLAGGRETSTGTRLLLAELRPRLAAESAQSRWVLHTDGILGRALLTEAGERVDFPLALSDAVVFDARVLMLAHDWRDGRGALRATVSAIDTSGSEQAVWSGVLRAGDRGRPRGLRVRCTLPVATAELVLSVQALGELRTGSVTRAVWLSPALYDTVLSGPGVPSVSRSGAGAPAATPSGRNGQGPLISVLTPVHNPPLTMLQEAIASVTSQTYPHWELCLIDDGSTDPAVISALQHHAATHPQIHLARHDSAQGISAATNHALTLAHGDYIALLDHDDTLTPDALQTVAEHIHTDPTLDMLYSDEDIVGEDGVRLDSHPKPGWSPDHFSLLMYTCHLGVYRRSLAEAVGGFRSRFDGCQDYDFVLRLIDRTDRVKHIPRTLYHWRAHTASTASGDEAKPFAYVSQPGAIAEHLDRAGVAAEVQFGSHPGMHRIVHRVDPGVTVDIAAAITSLHGLADAARSWATQPHPSWQLTLTAATALHDQITDLLQSAGIPAQRITLADPDTTNPAAGLAAAAQLGRSEHLLLMTSPAQGLTHNWLTRLIGYSQQPGIAATAPIILAPDGRIQHAGIAMPTGLPLHILHGLSGAGAPPAAFNAIAASGTLMTTRARYAEVGGLDPELGELAPVGWSLRAASDGASRITVVPDVRLRTTGPDPTINDLPAIRRLRTLWAATHGGDPYYNPRFRTDRADYILA